MIDAAALRAKLAASGLAEADLGWLDRLGWDDSRIPPVTSDAERDAYVRRIAALEAAVSHLGFADRGASSEGRLAAALGARVADWREPDGSED